jgi:uncharacterized protein
MTPNELINHLQLIPHPEGGYYRQTYKSEETTLNRNGDLRSVCTAIYFLLRAADKSHFHRIQSDELWFFHMGQAIEIFYISEAMVKTVTLGNQIQTGEVLLFKIPANTWFAARLKKSEGFALVSCTVAPGFDFADFELAQRAELISEFPDLKDIIEEFTQDSKMLI